MTRRTIAFGVMLVATLAGGCRETRRSVPAGPSPVARVRDEQQRMAIALSRLEHKNLSWPDDRARFTEAARIAWAFMDRHYHAETGFVAPIGAYPYGTIWDIASMLGAVYSARGLNLIDDEGYEKRVRAILSTLQRMPLYDHRAFNKAYDTRTGTTASGRWTGWSATDIGRLLVWLKIVGADARFQAGAQAIVDRMDYGSLVKGGYLWGEGLDEKGKPHAYQEGTIGYEQYAAQGFALWGHRAEKALSLNENALPISVMGQPLVADYRRWDRLIPEPFLLWGLEVGWDPQTTVLVRRMLRAQETRYMKTGLVTIAGEDSIDLPPYYFYYYCIYENGKDFGVDVQNRRGVADGPRWISAKSAFAYHALMPTRYTELAVQAVANAHEADGWDSGVYEGTGKPTGAISINTAAVILTAALVNERGAPLLAQAEPPTDR